MFTKFIFWPWFTGLIFLIAGLIAPRRQLTARTWTEKTIALGPVLFGVPFATFGAEHLVGANFMQNMVPGWIPGHLFWVYFVGFALLSASLSIIFSRYVGLSGTLLGAMILLFVLLLHVPRVMARLDDRFSWTVAFRDLTFASAAWAMAGSHYRRSTTSGAMIATGRYVLAITMIFFAVEHFLHPANVPGVPLEKMMPPWIMFPAVWSYLTGTVLLSCGFALLLKYKDRFAATCTGLFIALIVLLVYLPMLPMATLPSQMNEATNYIADTMLFAGSILIVGSALPSEAKPNDSI